MKIAKVCKAFSIFRSLPFNSLSIHHKVNSTTKGERKEERISILKSLNGFRKGFG